MDYDDFQRMVEAEAARVLERVAEAFDSMRLDGAYPATVAEELRASARSWYW